MYLIIVPDDHSVAWRASMAPRDGGDVTARPARSNSGGERHALDGVRVLDLSSGIAGGYCTMLIAGLGADVVKIEAPDGDPLRLLPPFAGEDTSTQSSLAFLHVSRGKRSAVLDHARDGDRDLFRSLAGHADLLVVDGSAAAELERWGTSPGELRQQRPALVVASLVGFGGPGPWAEWKATELTLAAASGLAFCTGEPDRSPLKSGGYLCSVAHGQTAAASALAALLAAKRSGSGSDVEVSGVEANADLLEMWALGSERDRPMPRQGRHHNSNYPFEVFPCRDGLVGVHVGPGPWLGFHELVGAELLLDPAFAGQPGMSAGPPGSRMAQRERIDPVIIDWLADIGKFDAYHAGQSKRFAFGYVATAEDLVRSPQLDERDFFVTIDHPHAPQARYPGPPFRLASGWRDARAPLHGEHTAEVSREAASLPAPGSPPRQPDGDAPQPADPARPLDGVRVLDLTQIWAGPRATKVLSDYGAEVVKVESRSRTDGTRGYARYLADNAAGRIGFEREHNRRGAFEQLHRGQRSITLDLRSETGARAFRELVAVSDVVIANFAYGVLARLGIAWPDLEPVNPRIVLISMTAFGDSGPERDYVGYGVTQEELSGIYGMTGYEDGEPLKSGTNIGDPMNGMHGAAAIIAALLERERTGRGQYIEFSQLESSIVFIGEAILDYTVNGRVTAPAGNTHPLWAPHGIYPARGVDQWLAIAPRGEEGWAGLTHVLEAPSLRDDPRFRTLADRLRHRAELDEALGRWTARRDKQELAEALQAAAVPASPVLTSIEVLQHQQYAQRSYAQVVEHPDGGAYQYFGPLWRIDGERPRIRGPAPLLGEHNEAVLATLTTLTKEEIATAGG